MCFFQPLPVMIEPPDEYVLSSVETTNHEGTLIDVSGSARPDLQVCLDLTTQYCLPSWVLSGFSGGSQHVRLARWGMNFI